MARTTKKDRPPALIRAVLARNVEVLRDLIYSDHISETAKNLALAKDAKTVLAQVQRIVKQELGVSIDMLDDLARALKCTPRDLLTPYFMPPELTARPAIDSDEEKKATAANIGPRRTSGS